jgi:hypothetical protein
MIACCATKLSIDANIPLYYKFISNLKDSYNSFNKRIYGQCNVINIVMKLL